MSVNPGDIALKRAWQSLSQAGNDWDKASWAPAMAHNAVSYLFEAQGAYNVAQTLGGANEEDVARFYIAWWRLHDQMEGNFSVTYIGGESATSTKST